ncbi:PREDICTED: 1-aminocyclopropane-1-carboxylate synthase 2-like [Camelina sativa]|uniref:1-aminocyclopropane-1-carboxylate synthase 2-like n=1 Tax=Camelina sativa TaxID=90675 RepID=A0ABM0X3X9_CAMSA|nr:PREDICTED: 1-aminocyclopropane-1-carboxylate synthase 2-like [Camelina sativa]
MGLPGRNSGAILSKIATNNQHGENSEYFDGWKAYDKYPFHLSHNPHGIIQMGLAENQLCLDLIKDWIKENPESSICTLEGVHQFSDIANFQDYHGLKKFRQAIAHFMGKARGGRATFDPERVVMSGGATGANETIMFCLADPGDVFLIPSPYYAAFDRDLRWRTGVEIIPVPCSSSNNFRLTVEAVGWAYKKAQEANKKVKGLILTNPSNPLGTILDKDTLKDLVRFVTKKNIHLVVNEIYAATVFSGDDFVSVAEVVNDVDSYEVNVDLIHIVYSLSKDMGLPGFRVGIVYSYNDSVVSCARKISSFGLVSSQTQLMLASMLSDERFVENFLMENSKRLGKRHEVFTTGLKKADITCLTSSGGLFVWMDLRHLLRDRNSFESEIELWRIIIHKVKLNVSPGSSFHCTEPGWFRVCFANMDDDTLHVALRRIQDFVSKNSNNKIVEKATDKDQVIQNNNAKKQKWRQSNLRLSFRRLYEDGLSSPGIMSPHSPLLRA